MLQGAAWQVEIPLLHEIPPPSMFSLRDDLHDDLRTGAELLAAPRRRHTEQDHQVGRHVVLTLVVPHKARLLHDVSLCLEHRGRDTGQEATDKGLVLEGRTSGHVEHPRNELVARVPLVRQGVEIANAKASIEPSDRGVHDVESNATWPRRNTTALINTATTTAMIFAILIGAILLGYFMAVTKVPMALAAFFSGLPESPTLVMIFILITYVIWAG